jgi:hypothetical protein
LNWIVNEKNIAPHVALFDKSERSDGTFSLSDFRFDADANSYTCPAGKLLLQYRKHFTKPRTGIVYGNRRHYRAERRDCAACPLKAKCCPGPDPRKLSVSVHERPAISSGACATRPNTFSHGASAKRSRCCSRTSSASCGWGDYDYEDLAAPATSSPWPQSPKTSESSPS